MLHRRAADYAHAKQFKRLKRVLRRQRTILGSLLREVRRKMVALPQAAQDALTVWLQRAERIDAQRPHDKGKLYALHAPEVECIGKGKAAQPYEFGCKGQWSKMLAAAQRAWLCRRQAVEPAIGAPEGRPSHGALLAQGQ